MTGPESRKMRGADTGHGEVRFKLSIVCPYPVFPVISGGKIRIVEIARCLEDMGVDVTIVTPFHFTQKQRLFANESLQVRQIAYPFLIPYLFTGRPFPYCYLTSFHPGYAHLIRWATRDADIVQFEQVEFADTAAKLNKPVIYDSQNVEFDYVRSECRSNRVREIVGKRVFRLENTLVQTSARVFACSGPDRIRLCELYGLPATRIEIAPNGLGDVLQNTVGSFSPEVAHPELTAFETWAIFSGSDVEHNRTAVRFIVGDLAPKVGDRCAFVIHGGCGAQFIDDAPENVFFDNVPESFGAYAGPNTVALNPVVQGGGTNLKLLYYLAHGMSVVSTEFGMRGYDELRENVKISDLEGFAGAIPEAQSIPRLDTTTLVQRYSWRNSAERMLDCYRSIMQSQRDSD